jgi:general transcription factor 3C polypeptide 5 (transcription factor C subunit 1)
VPKRTGRKRKRGSIEPYQFQNSLRPVETLADGFAQDNLHNVAARPQGIRRLLRSLSDAKESYDIRPVGKIDQIHRFRGNYTLQFSECEQSVTY